MRSLLIIAGGRISTLASAFVLFAVLSRILPIADLNDLSLGLVYYGITLVIMDFGLQELITREVASQRCAPSHVLRSLLPFKLVLLLAVSITMALLLWLVYHGVHTAIIFLAVAAGVVRNLSDTIDAILLGTGRNRNVAGFALLYSLAALVVPLCAALLLAPTAHTVLSAQLLVGAILLGVRFLWIRRDQVMQNIRAIEPNALPSWWRHSLPFSIMQFAAVIGSSIPSLWISMNSELAPQLAIFYGAFRITSVAGAVGAALYGGIYASISRAWGEGNHVEFQRVLLKASLLLGMISVGYIGVIGLNSAGLTQMLYGPSLYLVAHSLQWQGLSVPFTVAALLPGAILPVLGQQRYKAIAVCIGTVITLPLITGFGAWYGIEGVSIGWTVAICMQSILIYIFCMKPMRLAKLRPDGNILLFTSLALTGSVLTILLRPSIFCDLLYWGAGILISVLVIRRWLALGGNVQLGGQHYTPAP